MTVIQGGAMKRGDKGEVNALLSPPQAMQFLSTHTQRRNIEWDRIHAKEEQANLNKQLPIEGLVGKLEPPPQTPKVNPKPQQREVEQAKETCQAKAFQLQAQPRRQAK